MAEESTTAKNTQPKKARTRSPNYPAFNLASAVERAETVFNEFGRSRVGDEDIAKALGYNKLHGKSRTVVSALKKYGLLEPDGDGFRISDDALDIINLDSDDPDRAKAMYSSALKPTLFAELHETYGDDPPGDSLLRNYLLKRNFNHNVADEVIRVYRDTMDLVSRKIEEYTPDDEPGEKPGDERREKRMQQERTGSGERGSDGTGTLAFDVPGTIARQQHYGLSEDRDVYLLFVGEQPTKEDIATLKSYLEVFEKRLPSDGSDSASGAVSEEPTTDNGSVGENGQHEQ